MENTIHDDDNGGDFITISVNDLHDWALEAMVMLSDGLTWHREDNPEEEHPLVMASPTDCADALIYVILMRLAQDGMVAVDDLGEDDEPPVELRNENGELIDLEPAVESAQD
jgi:hypothetical protein